MRAFVSLKKKSYNYLYRSLQKNSGKNVWKSYKKKIFKLFRMETLERFPEYPKRFLEESLKFVLRNPK